MWVVFVFWRVCLLVVYGLLVVNVVWWTGVLIVLVTCVTLFVCMRSVISFGCSAGCCLLVEFFCLLVCCDLLFCVCLF